MRRRKNMKFNCDKKDRIGHTKICGRTTTKKEDHKKPTHTLTSIFRLTTLKYMIKLPHSWSCCSDSKPKTIKSRNKTQISFFGVTIHRL